MHSSLWQTAFLFSLATAAPSSNIQQRGLEPLPKCPDKVNAIKGDNRPPSWMKNQPTDQEFCLSHWETGNRILSVTAWKQSNAGKCDGHGAINRMEFHFTDGGTTAIGSQVKDCDAGKLILQVNDIVTELTTWPSYDSHDNLGQIEIKTTPVEPQNGQTNQDVKFSSEEDVRGFDKLPSDKQAVKGGVIIGVMGHLRDGVIAHINFLFTPAKVKDVVRTNYSYDIANLNKNAAPTKADAYNDKVYNSANGVATHTFSHDREISQTTSSEVSHQYTFGAKASLTEEVSSLKIVDVSSTQEISYEYSTTDTSSHTNVETTKDTWVYGITQEPWTFTDCQFSYGSASGSYPYTCDVILNFDDQTSYTYQDHGMIKASIYSTDAISNCSSTPLKHGNDTVPMMARTPNLRF